MKIVAVFAIAWGLAFVAPAAAQPFAGYKAMSFPREDLPIGARWIPGVGPDGMGAPADNIEVTGGLSSAVITGNVKASIVAALGNYLGITGNLIRTENSTFNNLEVHRVRDLSALRNVRAGEQLLSQAIKAGTISIVTDTSGAAQIEASARRRGVPVSVSSGTGGGRRVELDGSDLFIAYQVVELGQPQVRTRTVRHRGDDVTIDDTWRFRFCCGSQEQVIIEAQNLRAVSASGEIPSTRWVHRIVENRDNEYTLTPHREGEYITAARVLFRYNPSRSCSDFTTTAGQRICVVDFPRGSNDVRLTTSRYRVRLVPNPNGVL